MARIPHHRRISAWFKANPNEWLSIEDIRRRFDISVLMARKAIGEANAGTTVIERVSVYRTVVASNPVSDEVSAEVSK